MKLVEVKSAMVAVAEQPSLCCLCGRFCQTRHDLWSQAWLCATVSSVLCHLCESFSPNMCMSALICMLLHVVDKNLVLFLQWRWGKPQTVEESQANLRIHRESKGCSGCCQGWAASRLWQEADWVPLSSLCEVCCTFHLLIYDQWLPNSMHRFILILSGIMTLGFENLLTCK